MDLKLPILFFILLLIPFYINDSYSLTVCDLIKEKASASDIQQAVDNGSILYSDLPGAFQVNIHAQGSTVSQPTKPASDFVMNCDKKTQTSSSDSAIIGIISVMLSFVFAMKLIFSDGHRFKRISFLMFTVGLFLIGLITSGILTKDPNGQIGACIITGAVLFGMGIAFYVRGKQIEEFTDMLEQNRSEVQPDSEYTRKILSRGTLPKGFSYDTSLVRPKKVKEETKHPPLAKILLLLKIVKVKQE